MNPDASQTLVLSSGLHGVEGFLGSAIQCAFLECARKSPSIRFVLLHGLNPFGFEHLRRGNEDNVDLNRNFLLPDEEFQGAPATYQKLNPLLNPPSPPRALDWFRSRAILAIAKHGMQPIKQAVAGGQYEYPKGLFFGGRTPASTQLVLRQEMADWLRGSDMIIHLDFHTGLGKRGACSLLTDYPLDRQQRNLLSRKFGRWRFSEGGRDNLAYSTSGSFGRWCVKMNFALRYFYLCAEFGTYGPLHVLDGLRRENQAYWFGSSSQHMQAARKLKDLFCPVATAWRKRCLKEGFGLIETAVEALQEGDIHKIMSP